jgi:hypothetical protein
MILVRTDHPYLRVEHHTDMFGSRAGHVEPTYLEPGMGIGYV